MITPDSPDHDKFLEQTKDKEYNILTDKMNPGDSIQCHDDSDMTIIKDEEGEVCLVKKSFRNDCFS